MTGDIESQAWRKKQRQFAWPRRMLESRHTFREPRSFTLWIVKCREKDHGGHCAQPCLYNRAAGWLLNILQLPYGPNANGLTSGRPFFPSPNICIIFHLVGRARASSIEPRTRQLYFVAPPRSSPPSLPRVEFRSIHSSLSLSLSRFDLKISKVKKKKKERKKDLDLVRRSTSTNPAINSRMRKRFRVWSGLEKKSVELRASIVAAKSGGKEEGLEWLGRTKSFWDWELVRLGDRPVIQLAQHPINELAARGVAVQLLVRPPYKFLSRSRSLYELLARLTVPYTDWPASDFLARPRDTRLDRPAAAPR